MAGRGRAVQRPVQTSEVCSGALLRDLPKSGPAESDTQMHNGAQRLMLVLSMIATYVWRACYMGEC